MPAPHSSAPRSAVVQAADRAAARAATYLRALRRLLRAVVGAPDYDGYLAHCQAAGHAPLDRAAFERERLAARYDRPGSRCC